MLEVIKDLLQQLLRRGVKTPACVQILKDVKSKGGNLTFAQAFKAFTAELQTYPCTFLILDALDEMSDQDRTLILTSLVPLIEKLPLKLLATSRDSWNIREEFKHSPCLKIIAQDDDMRCYIHLFIETGSRNLRRILKKDDIPIIMEKILEKSTNMYASCLTAKILAHILLTGFYWLPCISKPLMQKFDAVIL